MSRFRIFGGCCAFGGGCIGCHRAIQRAGVYRPPEIEWFRFIHFGENRIQAFHNLSVGGLQFQRRRISFVRLVEVAQFLERDAQIVVSRYVSGAQLSCLFQIACAIAVSVVDKEGDSDVVAKFGIVGLELESFLILVESLINHAHLTQRASIHLEALVITGLLHDRQFVLLDRFGVLSSQRQGIGFA